MTQPPLFFYGTLCDPDILAAVLRRQLAPGSVLGATAPGYAAVYFPGQFYPGLVARRGAVAPGRLLLHATELDRAALDAFEGDDYLRGPLLVDGPSGTIAAEAYLPAVCIPGSAADWTLERWTQVHKPDVLARETALARAARLGAGRR